MLHSTGAEARTCSPSMELSLPPTADLMYGFAVDGCTQESFRPSSWLQACKPGRQQSLQLLGGIWAAEGRRGAGAGARTSWTASGLASALNLNMTMCWMLILDWALVLVKNGCRV